MAKRVLLIGKEERTHSKKKIPLMPNPLPGNIIELVVIASTMNGLAITVYKLIKLWVEDRKAKKIIIKKGDIEVEIQGGMRTKEIKNAFKEFRLLAKVKNKKEVIVTIPENCDPSLSEDLLFKKIKLDE